MSIDPRTLVNSIELTGLVNRAPEIVRSIQQRPCGQPVYRFGVASYWVYEVDGEWRSEEICFDVEISEEIYEQRIRLLKKYRGIRVSGRLHQEHWISVGREGSHVYIVGDRVEPCGSYRAAVMAILGE